MFRQKQITEYYFTTISKWNIFNKIEKKIKFIMSNGKNSFEHFNHKKIKQTLITDYYSTFLNIKPITIQKTIKDYYKA
jgi:hypothetical protein